MAGINMRLISSQLTAALILSSQHLEVRLSGLAVAAVSQLEASVIVRSP